jgi:hypothetical protein
MPGRKDLEHKSHYFGALARVALAGAVVSTTAPVLEYGELNPGEPAPVGKDSCGLMVYQYTESPCRQLAVCENPYLPEIEGYYTSWWCTEINDVLHQCRWMYAMASFPSYDAYYAFWHSRRSMIVPCDGEQDECRAQKGSASEMVW